MVLPETKPGINSQNPLFSRKILIRYIVIKGPWKFIASPEFPVCIVTRPNESAGREEKEHAMEPSAKETLHVNRLNPTGTRIRLNTTLTDEQTRELLEQVEAQILKSEIDREMNRSAHFHSQLN